MKVTKEKLKELGKKIKIERIKKDLKQSELAKKIERPQSSISNIEQGKTEPSYFAIKALEEVFGVKF